MKKILVTLFAVFTFTALTVAQNTTFEKGTSVVSAGVGIGSNYYGLGYSMVIPQVFASYEYGIMDNLFSNGKGAIGVGGLIGYTSAAWKYAGASYNINYLTFATRGALHYEFVENLDTYGGISLGYYAVNHSMGNEIPWTGRSGAFLWELNVGARYYFTPNLAGMAEVGYGISALNIGISYRF